MKSCLLAVLLWVAVLAVVGGLCRAAPTTIVIMIAVKPSRCWLLASLLKCSPKCMDDARWLYKVKVKMVSSRTLVALLLVVSLLGSSILAIPHHDYGGMLGGGGGGSYGSGSQLSRCWLQD
ncbi:hypothetical protein CEXT_115901 [Caerostris extrusa]|uniref:Uncharacterized protein n=1 Tax=Caerostris extrusa TaxID=172846 RepID=A0AAV4T984_CAEEX|nr:hypothetical protein CEXT_115901 [Caerostris extrusa]